MDLGSPQPTGREGPPGEDRAGEPAWDRAAARAAIGPIEARLARLRRVSKAMLVWQRLGWLIAVFVAGGVLVAFTDYVLRMPGWLRGGFLGLGAAISALIILKRVAPAARFAPSLVEFALRVEQSPGGRRAGLEGLLASAVDLAQTGGPRAAAVIREAARRATSVGTLELIRPGRMLAATGAAGGIALLVAGLFVGWPSYATIGTMRILAPWADVQWPKRTDVESVTTQRVHPLGSALALRAAILSSAGAVERTRVEARYRIIDAEGQAGPVRRVMLTCQEKIVEAVARDALGRPVVERGTLFERLIEPGSLEPTEPGAGEAGSAARTAQLEYWFTSQDDETVPERVTLVRPPVVVGARAEVTPPAYAAGLVRVEPGSGGGGAGGADLGPGNDERATVAGVLPGSRVTLKLKFNKPLAPLGAEGGGGGMGGGAAGVARRDWLAATVGEQFAALVVDKAGPGGDGKPGTGFQAVYQGDEWMLAWTVRESLRLAVRPRDQFGIEADGESVYRIEAREDRPPEATVTKPAEDGEALPTATIEVVAEGRDDVGVESVSAEHRLARKPAGSEGAPPEPIAEYASAATAKPSDAGQAADGRTVLARGVVDLAAIGAKAGDELWLTALASDSYELDGVRHEPVRSQVRKIRIISSEQLVEQVWNELAAVRRNAIRLSEQQQALRDAVERRTDGPAAARDQTALSDAAKRQERAVDKLGQRLQENGLKDDDLKSVIDQARGLLEEAQDAAARAGSSLREQQDARAGGQEAKAQQARSKAQEEQAKTQDSLENLADLLDKGQDAWSVKRGLEKLLEEQKQVREQTAKLGEQTVGRSLEQLTAQQRQQAGQLSEQQQDLAQKAEDLVAKLQQQAEALKQQDPLTAASLQDAARKAERARLQEQLQQAARQIQQNQQQRATQQQARAEQAIQEMLDQIQQASRSRDEVLQRELASLIESLDALIARQEAELKALEAGVQSGRLTGLDGRMIALRVNTLAVLEQARSAGRETRDAATLIEGAATAQGDAISALRAEPPDAGEARTDEQASLEKLKEARKKAEEAKDAAQDRNARRQRAELKKAYRELLDQQIDLRAKTRDVAQMEAGRRQKAAARELSGMQDQLRQRVADLAAKNEDIGKSDVFRFAHDRIEDFTSAATKRLAGGDADTQVLNRQGLAIRALNGLLEALAEQDQKDDEFRENQGGGDQNGGGQSRPQPAIPRGAELKLLRDQQAQTLDLTRSAAEEKDSAGVSEAATLQRRLMELARIFLEKAEREAEQRGPGQPGQPAPELKPGPQPQPEPAEGDGA